MATGFEDDSRWREQLSALVDGEQVDVSSACARWRDDAKFRATWHCYQLIGDVLRSDDLAGSPARDEVLLRRVRAQVAREPAVLAPTAAPAAREAFEAPRRGWRAAGAVAAGIVAVAGTYTLMRPGLESPSMLARVPAASAALASSESPGAPFGASQAASGYLPVDSNTLVMRDARLDAYLAAHKQFAGSSSIGVPSVYLRKPTLDSGASQGR